MIYLKLFYEFFKIGLFSIGGGAATIPFLEELSEKTNWFTKLDLANMIAVSESTPGAIGVNMSTYVGYTTAGVFGGIVATLGLVAPSIIVIILIAQVLKKFRENRIIQYCFYGLRAASAALILSACWSIFEISILQTEKFQETHQFQDLFNGKALLFGVILGFLVFKFKKHPILYILLSAIIGIIFKFSLF